MTAEQLQAENDKLQETLNKAIQLMVKYAREAGYAEGRLEVAMSALKQIAEMPEGVARRREIIDEMKDAAGEAVANLERGPD